eukprot:354873-Chlamydomonas_euryale.AAC.10
MSLHATPNAPAADDCPLRRPLSRPRQPQRDGCQAVLVGGARGALARGLGYSAALGLARCQAKVRPGRVKPYESDQVWPGAQARGLGCDAGSSQARSARVGLGQAWAGRLGSGQACRSAGCAKAAGVKSGQGGSSVARSGQGGGG